MKLSKYKALSDKLFITKLFTFLSFLFSDITKKIKSKTKNFNDYGLTIYCGMQGYGKTISMVEKLESIRHKYPDVMICTNFGYIHEDIALTDWQQILTLRNDAGIVFAIDEIQNEFDVYDVRNFSQRILRTITQQRKQKIKIYGTAQHFNRVSKPLREQTFEVVDCFTVAGRWTFQKCFDAQDYNCVLDNPERKMKLRRKWRKNFVQSDELRNLYDSYEVIKNMAELEKKSRNEELVFLNTLIDLNKKREVQNLG